MIVAVLAHGLVAALVLFPASTQHRAAQLSSADEPGTPAALGSCSDQERLASPPRSLVLDHPVRLASPPPAFVAVNRALREAKCIRADFDELKKIQVLKRPRSSSGSLVLCAELGLFRAVREPFVLEILVTPTEIAQRDAQGRVERVDVEKQPLARGFIDAFLLVFSGDEKALAAEFDLFFDGAEQAWTLGFVPRKKPLSRFIASLVVTGHGGILDTLLVVETNGDSTASRFSNVVTARELSPDERERFFSWQK